MINTWNYNNPSAAYLFLLIPLLSLFAWFGWAKVKEALISFGNPEVRRQSQEHSTSTSKWRIIFLSLAGIWTILTLMDPFEEVLPKGRSAGSEQLLTRINQEIWIMLDMSASMSVRDEEGGQTRLDVAKKTAEELLRLLPGRPVRLYTFTSQAHLLVPLTWDHLFVQLTLQNLSIDPLNPGGTDFAHLFNTLKEALKEHRFFANSALIFLTDGGDTAWESAQGEAKQKRLQTLRTALPKDHAALFAVGFGSAKGGIVPNVVYDGQNVLSVLDRTLLSYLITPADRLFFSQTHSPYQLARELKESIDRTLSYETERQNLPTLSIQNPRFIFPLTLAILSLLAALLIPGLPTRLPANSKRG